MLSSFFLSRGAYLRRRCKMATLKLHLKDCDALILDFGGVLMNIDYSAATRAFANLGVTTQHLAYSQQEQTSLFDNLETGRITPEEFRTAIRQLSGLDVIDAAIDNAWNAMILDFPATRPDFLKKLRLQKPLYLLSNTNEIHYRCFSKRIKETTDNKLEELFDKTYYSHQMGMRKPEVEIFEYVLKTHSLNPNKTFFIDDSIQHVEGARKAGLQAFLLPAATDIESVFQDIS